MDEVIEIIKERKELRYMSSDDMFKELGYKKDLHTDRKGQVWGEWWTEDKHCKKISFDYIDKEICVCTNYLLDITNEAEPLYFDMKDLKAINKKVEELGWLERN